MIAILVILQQTLCQYSDGDPQRGHRKEVGYEKYRNLRQICRFIS